MRYYSSAAEIFEDLGNKYYLSTALLGLGTAKRSLNKNQESIDCLTKALTILKGSSGISLIISVSLNLAISYLSADENKKAMQYYDKSMSLIRKVKDKTLAGKLYQGFAEVYEKKNDFKNAYIHFVKYHKLYAETFRKESERVNKILRLKYAKEKSDREAEIYRLKNSELKERSGQKQKSLMQWQVIFHKKMNS